MNTDAKRYYALLGLDPQCAEEDIRSAFRRRAKELHPDVESGDVMAFIRLKRAYDTLSDPAKRAHYDRVNNPRLRRAMRATVNTPPPSRVRPSRSGGMSFARYFVAFLFMGGLSFGAIEAMISYADGNDVGSTQPVSLLTAAPKEAAKDDPRADARAAAGAGFWDPPSADISSHDAITEAARPLRGRSNGLGALSAE